MSLRPVLLALVLAAVAAGAAEAKASLHLEAHDSYFTLFGQDEKNPVLVHRPGPVVLALTQKGAVPHNWALEGVPEAVTEYVVAADSTVTVTFTLPDGGTFRYFCEAHTPVMAGMLRVGEAAPEEGNDAPAAGVAALAFAFAAASAAASSRRR